MPPDDAWVSTIIDWPFFSRSAESRVHPRRDRPVASPPQLQRRAASAAAAASPAPPCQHTASAARQVLPLTAGLGPGLNRWWSSFLSALPNPLYPVSLYDVVPKNGSGDIFFTQFQRKQIHLPSDCEQRDISGAIHYLIWVSLPLWKPFLLSICYFSHQRIFFRVEKRRTCGISEDKYKGRNITPLKRRGSL